MDAQPPALRAVLLDLDGTITDRAATVRAYTSSFLRDFGAGFGLSEPEQVARELARIDRNGYNPARASDLAAHQAWSVSPGAPAIASHWNEHFVRSTQGRPQVATTLDALAAAGLKLGVVSNGRTSAQQRKLELLGLRQRFDVVLISEALGMKKPDARMFQAAADQLGVAPEQCVFVGDNPLKDVQAAAAAGMLAVWFRATCPWPAELAPPAQSVRAFVELLALPQLQRLLPNANRLLS
jgi:putative hydrolase of the HAD superfamily